MAYKEEEYLQLSGIQHFSFCRRQWALIHIEQQWAENVRTADGRILHEKAHDCDVVEFRRGVNGNPLQGQEGSWQPYPVEYKRGTPKVCDADRLQLCAQAMCLETMLCCDIPEGALYYGQTRHRETVTFDDALRQRVRDMQAEMHELYRRSYTPKVKPSGGCSACSLKELCLPKLIN